MPATPLRRLLLLLGALFLAVAALGLALSRQGLSLDSLPLYDYVEYWAAGQLLAGGENPYDQARLAEWEAEAGRTEGPIPMLNPPWALPLVLPLGWLSVRAGHLLWLTLNLAALIAATELLWRHFGGAAERRLLGPIVAFTFVPTLIALLIGQIAPFVLLGAAAFLPLVRRRLDLAAGAATAFLAIKPHMAYLFWVALVIWAIGARRWRILAGGALAGLFLVGVASAFRPTVLADYWEFAREPPWQYRSATWGMVLRLGNEPESEAMKESFRLQYLPMLPGLAWLAWHGWRRRHDWNWSEQLPLLLLVSTLTAAYGAWLFDLVLLLVPVLDLAARLSRAGSREVRLLTLVVHALTGIATLVLLSGQIEYLAFIWIPPLLLVGYVALTRILPSPISSSFQA
jgi:hypothetical protein